MNSRFSHDRFVSFGIGQHSTMYVITMEDFVALTGAEKQTSSTDTHLWNHSIEAAPEGCVSRVVKGNRLRGSAPRRTYENCSMSSCGCTRVN